MTEQGGLYGALAKYYDLIYDWKDYGKETLKIKKLVAKHKRSSGTSLLDVACGTGKHIQYLKDDFNCTGVDVSEDMLAVARKNVPDVEFVNADMVDFDLGRKFDVVLCLFSSIGYLKKKRAINEASRNFAKHMEKGGILIIEPWIRRSQWKDMNVDLQTYDSDSLKIARVNFGRAKGEFSVLDERYLIAEKGRGITYLEDQHVMRFFDRNSFLAALRNAGLDSRFTEYSLMPGRGLIIAIKP